MAAFDGETFDVGTVVRVEWGEGAGNAGTVVVISPDTGYYLVEMETGETLSKQHASLEAMLETR